MADEIQLTEEQRLSLVRKLWTRYPERGETAAMNFYQEMEQDHPELLRRGPGDDYQRLRGDLAGLFDEPPAAAEVAN